MGTESAKHAHNADGLTKRQELFCNYWLELRDGTKAAKAAGYSEKSARQTATNLMKSKAVLRYIDKRLELEHMEHQQEIRARIASADEVNAFLSDVMQGKVKDAFGLDPGLSDRISAAKELRRIYDVIDKYKATVADTDALSQSLDAFINGNIAENT